jgi:hypothetical protein
MFKGKKQPFPEENFFTANLSLQTNQKHILSGFSPSHSGTFGL